jgi:hypothetical protein
MPVTKPSRFKEKGFRTTQGLIALLALGAALSIGNSSIAGPINLGSAANYAVVGVGGTVSITSNMKVYQSATVINGNVAQGPYTSLTHGVDATINGRWDYDNTDGLLASNNGFGNPTTVGVTGAITGGIFQKDLSGVAADARAAAAAGAALGMSPTQTFTSLNQFDGVGSIVGNGGLNIIDITSTSALKISLTLTGTASDRFVFVFTDTTTTAGHDVLSLSGMTMNIGSINPDNIDWVFNGLGGDLSISSMAVGQTVYGNFIAPDRNILSDHGIINGRLIGGGSGTLLNIHSGSEITVPSVPDGGSTLLLLGMAMTFVGLIRSRKNYRQLTRK